MNLHKDFPQIPATSRSKSLRRPIHGFGVNDSPYTVTLIVDGKLVKCPFYRTWANMLERCYSQKYQNKFPTYIGCTVTQTWLLFSEFRAWMVEQAWEGNHLDKDVLIVGNKKYGPDTCLFVSPSINTLLVSCTASRGRYPQGVHFNKRKNIFTAHISQNGKQLHLGCFKTPKEAHQAYCAAKKSHLLEVSKQQSDPRIRTALIRIATKLEFLDS